MTMILLLQTSMTVILSRICADGEVNHNNGYGREVQLLLVVQLLVLVLKRMHQDLKQVGSFSSALQYACYNCLNPISVILDGPAKVVIHCSSGTFMPQSIGYYGHSNVKTWC